VKPFSVQLSRWFGGGIENAARFGRRQELGLSAASRTPLSRRALARDDQNSFALNRDAGSFQHPDRPP